MEGTRTPCPRGRVPAGPEPRTARASFVDPLRQCSARRLSWRLRLHPKNRGKIGAHG
jgi:hypothetical protein